MYAARSMFAQFRAVFEERRKRDRSDLVKIGGSRNAPGRPGRGVKQNAASIDTPLCGQGQRPADRGSGERAIRLVPPRAWDKAPFYRLRR